MKSTFSNEKSARLGLNWLGFDIRTIAAIEPFSVTSADFDKDGNVDLAYASPADMYVLEGDGAGNLLQMNSYHQPTGTFHPMLIYDPPPHMGPGYNEDYCVDQDFYCEQSYHYHMAVDALLFEPPMPGCCGIFGMPIPGSDIVNSSVISSDLNNDSYPDLLLAGWFWKRHEYIYYMDYPGRVCLGGYSCCLDSDIATSGKCQGWIDWPAGPGGTCTNNFVCAPIEEPKPSEQCCNLWTECTNPLDVFACDWGNANYQNAAQTFTRQYITSFLGGGDFSFANSFMNTGYSANELLIEDLDSDGQDELVLPDDSVNEDWMTVCGPIFPDCLYNFGISASSLALYQGAGDGSFSSPTSQVLDGGFEYTPGALRMTATENADIDGDLDLDLLVANSSQNKLVIMLGDGAGNFANSGTVSTGNGPVTVSAGDLDLDGDADLAVGYAGDCNKVSVFWNDGAGNFASSLDLSTGITCDTSKFRKADIKIVELNRDGVLDIVYAYPIGGANNLAVFPGNGDATFTTAYNYALGTAGSSCWQAARAEIDQNDFNNDGMPDLAVSISQNHQIYILLGIEPPKTCAGPGECASGFCVDGYCCDSSCNGICVACNLAGSEGTCTAIPHGQDPAGECIPDSEICAGHCSGAGSPPPVESFCEYSETEMLGCDNVCEEPYRCGVENRLCQSGICKNVFGPYWCQGYTCSGGVCYGPLDHCTDDSFCCVQAGYHCNTGTGECVLP